MGATSATTAPARHVPPKNKGKVVAFSGRALGAATNAITLQAGESSRGLTIAYAAATGRYTVTLPGKGGCQLGAAHVTYEGTDTLDARVISRSETARTVTFQVDDETGTAQSLIAAQYLNFTIYVLDV